MLKDFCKKCGSKVSVHYAAGFDIYTCKKCNISVDGRKFYEFFEEREVK